MKAYLKKLISIAALAALFLIPNMVIANHPSPTAFIAGPRFTNQNPFHINGVAHSIPSGIQSIKISVAKDTAPFSDANESQIAIKCQLNQEAYQGQTNFTIGPNDNECQIYVFEDGNYRFMIEVIANNGQKFVGDICAGAPTPCTTVDTASPNALAPPVASLNSDNTITVTFNAPSDPAPSSGLWYQVTRTPDWSETDVKALQFSDGSANTFYYTNNGSTRTFIDWWVSPGTSYSYNVRMFDNAGNERFANGQSNQITTPAPPPPTPGSPSNSGRVPSSGTPSTGTPTQPPVDSDGDGIPDSEEEPEEEPKPEEEVKGAEENPRNFVGVAIGVAAVLAALGGALIYALRRRMKEFEALGFDEETIESDTETEETKKR